MFLGQAAGLANRAYLIWETRQVLAAASQFTAQRSFQRLQQRLETQQAIAATPSIRQVADTCSFWNKLKRQNTAYFRLLRDPACIGTVDTLFSVSHPY